MIGENPSETLRSCELPKSGDATALQFGDWLSLVDSMMGDMSYSSSTWWVMVRKAATDCYQRWLLAAPLDRLRLKPQLDPAAAAWPRTERQALSRLLGVIPETILNNLLRLPIG